VPKLPQDAASLLRYERAYLVLASLFVVMLVLTNVIGAKLFMSPFDPAWALTTGILTYPITFLCTDLVSEVWGQRRADFMVLLGFLMSLAMLAVLQLAMGLPPHEAWASGGLYTDGWSAGPGLTTGTGTEGYDYAYASVFSVSGTLLFGSMLAYAVAQLTDNRLFHFFRRLTNGKHLWLRNNGSTLISQAIDTAIVNSILFYYGFGMEFWLGVEIMLTIYFHKVLLAALDTPFIYLGVAWLKRYLRLEEVEP